MTTNALVLSQDSWTRPRVKRESSYRPVACAERHPGKPRIDSLRTGRLIIIALSLYIYIYIHTYIYIYIYIYILERERHAYMHRSAPLSLSQALKHVLHVFLAAPTLAHVAMTPKRLTALSTPAAFVGSTMSSCSAEVACTSRSAYVILTRGQANLFYILTRGKRQIRPA